MPHCRPREIGYPHEAKIRATLDGKNDTFDPYYTQEVS